MFSTQHNRCFVPFLAICANVIRFIVNNCQGQVFTKISYHNAGEHHTLNLICVIVALMFAGDETLGFDHTISTHENGDLHEIAAGGKVYKVKTTIHAV